MPTTLIQLISDQTIPNLLPVLRLRPQRLIHLVTPRTADRSAVLLSALKRVNGDKPRLESILLSAMPSIQECFDVVDRQLQGLPVDQKGVVNFTGGTKLMSIGAYAAAQLRGVPSLYVDTQDACFVDGATSPDMTALMEGNWSFTPISDQLRVDVLAVANGVKGTSRGHDWQAMLPLAHMLFDDYGLEEKVFEAIQGPNGLHPLGKEPNTPAAWLARLDKPFKLPEPVAKLAVDAGWLRQGRAAGEVLLPDACRSELEMLQANQQPYIDNFAGRYYACTASLQRIPTVMVGGWWETIVCDALQQSGRFRDIRWSCDVSNAGGAVVEEDVLAVDGVELLYVNCKRGGQRGRLLPLLEEIRSRAITMGGSFNRRFLALLHPPSPKGQAGRALISQAERLGIRIVTGRSVYESGAFAR